MVSKFYTLVLLLLCGTAMTGQEAATKKIESSVLAGYKVGGLAENRNFVIKNGPGIHLGLHYLLTSKLRVGLGVGFEQLERDRFFPIYCDLRAKFKDTDSSPFLKVRIGGALANNLDIEQFKRYDFDGGLYFSAGWGYFFKINERLGLIFELNLEFQQAELEFQSFAGQTFEEDFQYYFLAFKTGVNF